MRIFVTLAVLTMAVSTRAHTEPSNPILEAQVSVLHKMIQTPDLALVATTTMAPGALRSFPPTSHPDHIFEPDGTLVPATPRQPNVPGLLTVAPPSDVNVWLQKGYDLAKGAVALSYQKTTDAGLKKAFLHLFEGLLKAKIQVPPPGFDFKHCSERTLAFATVGAPYVYLCSLLIDTYGSSTLALAQTLVHEAVHTVGVSDECVATTYEAASMQISGLGVQYQNGYWATCFK